GADSNAGKFIFDADLTVPTAIIMGSEDEGISALSRKYLTNTVKIPLQNNFDSYNVSVAAGMILYEVMRQRM
ncbi:MAG TPA: TrmH family RNA methyltransferase, partial [Chitinophagales bacterium]|nr:TrmH family RNA methyltransferase [Chitinophagales bacterium]